MERNKSTVSRILSIVVDNVSKLMPCTDVGFDTCRLELFGLDKLESEQQNRFLRYVAPFARWQSS